MSKTVSLRACSLTGCCISVTKQCWLTEGQPCASVVEEDNAKFMMLSFKMLDDYKWNLPRKSCFRYGVCLFGGGVSDRKVGTINNSQVYVNAPNSPVGRGRSGVLSLTPWLWGECDVRSTQVSPGVPQTRRHRRWVRISWTHQGGSKSYSRIG